MFEQFESEFKTLNTRARASTASPITIMHTHKGKKNEMIFKLTREAMDKCHFEYGETVIIQFAAGDTICRLKRSSEMNAMKLSQQVKDNPNSASLIRLTYKDTLPNFLSLESEKHKKTLERVIYENDNEMTEYLDGQVTFKLSEAKVEEKKS